MTRIKFIKDKKKKKEPGAAARTSRAIKRAIRSGKEVCIAAAIKWQGKVWLGHRHGYCMEAMRQELGWNMTGKQMMRSHMFNDQGFLTNRGRYVGREEGFKLQMAAKIPSAAREQGDDYRNGILFSEDLH